DSLEAKVGQDLMQYDVKRLGYETLDSARTSVLQHIEERAAQAYARMFLIAERIGEMPLKVAEPGYRRFLEKYSDFPAYTSFLKTLYDEIKKVSPGQPAIPFALPNAQEEIVRLTDYRAKYVLLDFWDISCIPCLIELPHMTKLYERSRHREFEILAISIEIDSPRWTQSIRQFQTPWPQPYGGEGFPHPTLSRHRGSGIPLYS